MSILQEIYPRSVSTAALADDAPGSTVDPVAPVKLGRTGLTVSRLGLGGAPLATIFWGNDEATAAAAVERALGIGDPALRHRAPLRAGESERRIGSVLAAAAARSTSSSPRRSDA